jgi:N6-adenosine-specific RNA methylase IME4
MTISEIKALPVADLADKDCILFLWVTFPLLQEGLDTIKAWGFKYKTLGFSWIKTNTKNNKPFFGIGHYTKSNCEVCLIGVRGKPKIASNKVSSVEISHRGRHSAKPPIVRDKIVELMGDLPRVELFSRDKVPGWLSWGNEIDSDIVLEGGKWKLANESQEGRKRS